MVHFGSPVCATVSWLGLGYLAGALGLHGDTVDAERDHLELLETFTIQHRCACEWLSVTSSLDDW
jgi:hypothetical protein